MSQLDPEQMELQGTAKFADRIAALLESPKAIPGGDLVDWLDALLGAVYSLHYAQKLGYTHRPSASTKLEQQKMLDELKNKTLERAMALANGGEPRNHGKWMAGFHFNNALYRISACHDRGIKIATGYNLRASGKKEGQKSKHLTDSKEAINEIFRKCHKPPWSDTNAAAIREQVSVMKHREGIHGGRKSDAALVNAILAVRELLELMETWTAATP